VARDGHPDTLSPYGLAVSGTSLGFERGAAGDAAGALPGFEGDAVVAEGVAHDRDEAAVGGQRLAEAFEEGLSAKRPGGLDLGLLLAGIFEFPDACREAFKKLGWHRVFDERFRQGCGVLNGRTRGFGQLRIACQQHPEPVVEAGSLGCDGVGRVVKALDLFLQPRAGPGRGSIRADGSRGTPF
jgi:hypothetical protein